jgi:hypothetical protein
MVLLLLMFITLNAIPVEIHGMGFTENINGIVDQYCRVFTLMANAIKHLSVDDISYSQGKYPTNYSYSLESIQVLHMQTIHDSCSVKDFTITSDSNGALIKASTGYPGLYATLQFQYKLILNGLTVSFGTLTGYIGSRKSDFQCLFKTGISDTHCSLKAHFNMDMFTLKGVDVTNDVKEKIKLPLYYTGLTENANIRQEEGKTKSYKISREYEVEIEVPVKANSYTWLVVE